MGISGKLPHPSSWKTTRYARTKGGAEQFTLAMEARQRYFYGQKLRQKDDEIEELRQCLSNSEAGARILEIHLQQAEGDNERLQSELQKLQYKNDANDSERARLIRDRDILRGELREAKAKLSECAPGLEEERARHKAQTEASKVLLQSYLSAQEEWTRRKGELEDDNEKLREKVQRISHQKHQCEIDIRHLQVECAEYEKVLGDERQAKWTLQQSVAEHTKKIEAIERQLEREKREVRRLIIGCQEQIRRDVIGECKKRLQALSEENRQLKEDKKKGEGRLKEIQEAISFSL